jgi:SAM-dependent methyltransferase
MTADPTNMRLHLANAQKAFSEGHFFLAYAELKSAQYLGLSSAEFEQYREPFEKALPPTDTLNHNTYYRLASLATEIEDRSATLSNFSILDVGGGHGSLAAFIRHASYCLAEPTVNGISGTALPFEDESFDFTVSCHVLEHVPEIERSLFLDQLLSKSRKGVLLLNPFEIPGTFVQERLKLMIDITDAEWAKEHLECSLPKISDIEEYAAERGLKIFTKPNGTMTTSIALVFMEHFAKKSKSTVESKAINLFFNEHFMNIMDSNENPNAYSVFIEKP